MKIVPVPADGYGKFYNGDAYIIYACTEYGQAGGVHMKVSKLILYFLLILYIIIFIASDDVIRFV